MKAETFAAFIAALDAPRGSVAVLDNVSFHKTAAVRQAARQRGIKLLFIPPYSPEFKDGRIETDGGRRSLPQSQHVLLVRNSSGAFQRVRRRVS